MPSPGLHTVSVWAREDGISLDRIVLQTQGAAPSGDGPPESARDGSAPPAAPGPSSLSGGVGRHRSRRASTRSCPEVGDSWSTGTAQDWTAVVSSPITRYEGQGAAVNGKLYALGGYTTCCPPAVTPASHVYDPAADSWSAIADLPIPVTHAGTAVVGDEIVIAGGFVGDSPGAATAEVWRYDTVTRHVDPRRRPAGRPGGGGAGPDRRRTSTSSAAAVRAGVSSSTRTTAITGSSPTRDRMGRARTAGEPAQPLAGVALGGRIYAIGGQHLDDETSGNQSTVEIYDPASATWSAGPELPQPLGHIAASTFVRDGRIVVIGGKTQNKTLVDDVIELDPLEGTWSSLPEIPTAVQSPLAESFGDRIVVATGGGGGDIYADTFVLDGPGAGPPGSVGSALAVSPDDGSVYGIDPEATAPELSVAVDFPTAGTWHAWVRGHSADASANSVHLGLDGAVQPASADLDQATLGDWSWFDTRLDPPSARIEVPSPGVHTLNVWAREDGFWLDRLVLTTDPSFTPAGDGPPESGRGTG